MKPSPAQFKDKKNSIIREWSGKLTRELLLEPGGFGLGKIPSKNLPETTTAMTCGYCSTGCSLNIHLKDGKAIGLTPATQSPVNEGSACPKGWEALTVLDAPDRATRPLLKDDSGKQRSVSWDQAMSAFTDRFKAIQKKHGSHSVAFLGTGQIPTEELAYLGSLAKFGMGMVHGDGNTRQCMATAVTAYKQSFGFDAPPYTYKDFEESDVLVFVGSNLCIAHPILWERVLKNKNNPEIIVVDPRKTETAMAATAHLPIRPKSDLVLLYGLAHLIIKAGWVDEKFVKTHTAEFYAFKNFVRSFTPVMVEKKTGLTLKQLQKTAKAIGRGKRVSFWWTMGVNQSHEGTRTAQAIINLALMTGNIGKAGTGPNSITGQCNAMGSRLFSNTTSLLGGRDFKNADHRFEVAKILQIDEVRIPRQDSLAYDQIVEAIIRGEIKGLWIVATNSAHSWINQNNMREVLDRLDFLVVQDMYHNTETARQADLVLPAAGWGEKEGTFINSERRFGILKKVRKAPGQALADFSIFRLVAHFWGVEHLFKKWKTPEDVFQSLKALSVGRPCDFSGIKNYIHLDAQRGIQWPYRGKKDQGIHRRLFSDGKFHHPDQKAKFIFSRPQALPEGTSKSFPFLLLTGRGSAAQWHTQTRTAKSEVLRNLYPKNIYVEVNPADAARLGFKNADKIKVVSRTGNIEARAHVTPTIAAGQLFVPMHYVQANQLTMAEFDPHSRQPSYKATPVTINPLPQS